MNEDAGKAKIIWNHTFLFKRSLTQDQADFIGHKLGWIVTNFKTDVALVHGNGDIKVLSGLEDTQRLISALLTSLSDEKIINEISHFYWSDYSLASLSGETNVPTLSELTRGLKGLKIAIGSRNSEPDSALAKVNRKHERHAPSGSSSMDRFIYNLADLYENQSGKKAGVSRVRNQTEVGGPFVRFVEVTTEQYKLTAASGQTIASALHKRKRSVPPPKHIIGALKLANQ